MIILEFFSQNRIPFWTVLSSIGKYFGEEITFMIALCVLIWCIDKKLAYRIGFAFYFSSFLSQELKIICRIPRPWILNSNVIPLESALPTATGYSFPSAHSQAVASVYGTLAFNTKKTNLKTLCVCAIIITAWSRMYAGVHTPLDVSVGLILGTVGALITFIWISPLIEKGDPAIWVCSVLSGLCMIGFLSPLALAIQNIVLIDHGKDILAISGSGIGFALSYYVDTRIIHLEVKGSIFSKFIKVIIGIVTVLLIKIVLKSMLAPIGMYSDFIRYFFMTLWAMLIFPYWFNKI